MLLKNKLCYIQYMDFNRKLWVGLTGGIATGKSSVSKYLIEKGVAVIDADAISHSLLKSGSPAIPQIKSIFGPNILTNEGAVDRPKLGDIVFSSPQLLKKLGQIMHPLVRNKTEDEKQKLTDQGHSLIINDIPLLFENNLQSDYDCTVLVYCDQKTQKMRLKNRNHLTDIEVKNRIASQVSIDSKVSLADYVIDNSGTLKELHKNIDNFLNQLLLR